MTMHITQQHRDIFTAVTSRQSDIALLSCFVNGEPTAAIVSVNKGHDGVYRVIPLYVSITPGMTLTDHEGNEA